MFSYWIYLLIGQNKTGKTTFQRHLVNYLRVGARPLQNVKGFWEINLRAPQRTFSIYVANRSYQEIGKSTYASVQRYLENEAFIRGQCPSATILSTHSDGASVTDIQDIIMFAKDNCFNIAGVFFSNDTGSGLNSIRRLDWDEKLWVDNPVIKNKQSQRVLVDEQLRERAVQFGDLLINRSKIQ